MQHKKCPSFDAMQTLFGQTPSCKPVDPKEIGGIDSDSVEDEGDDGQAEDAAQAPTADPPPAAVKAAAAATAPLAPATGKGAAVFHLAPSKNKVRHHYRRHHCVYVTVTQDKKMDLGEAYMKAQQLKIESAAVTANTRTRTELIIAMMVQKKTHDEIAEMLKLAGF
jgi:hypothetical protein